MRLLKTNNYVLLMNLVNIICTVICTVEELSVSLKRCIKWSLTAVHFLGET